MKAISCNPDVTRSCGQTAIFFEERFALLFEGPGDLVIGDNLASHKVGGHAALAAPGAQLLYLPADSPDLNPIELAFAKLKSALRTAAACGWDDLIRATAAALATFAPEHCTNFFHHAQYATT